LKKLLVYLFFIILLLIPASLALANTNPNVSANINDSKQVTINGTIDNGSGQTVHIRVEDPTGAIDYAGTTMSKKDGSFSLTYTMTNTAFGIYKVTVNTYGDIVPSITEFSYGTDNELASMLISSGTFDNEFSSNITEYRVTVAHNLSRIKLTPTASESSSLIDVDGTAVDSGKSTGSLPLDDEETMIKINVTSLSGQVKTYTLTIIKSNSDIPTLTAFASIDANKKVILKGNINTGYGQIIAVRVMSPTGKVVYAGSTVSLAGGNYELSYLLSSKSAGKYEVMVGAVGVKEVATTSFYYITDVVLEGLTISDMALSPAFKSKVTEYTSAADGSFDSIIVTPVACEGADKIIVNKQPVQSGEASKPIRLREGSNTLTITVYAPNEAINKTYIITIIKANKIPDIALKAEINHKKLVSISGNTGIKASRAISVFITDPSGITEYTNHIKSSADGSFQLAYIMQNKAKGEYRVSVGAVGLKAPRIVYFTYNPIVDLSDLFLDKASLSPAFANDQLYYSSYVDYSVDSVRITATAVNSKAEITVNGSIVNSGQESTDLLLWEGVNIIPVVVTSFDESKTYYITITRGSRPQSKPSSSNADLISLSLSSVTLSPVFSPNTTEYTANVENEVDSIIVVPIAADYNATIKVNGTFVTSGSASGSIGLNIGINTINITIIAESGSTKTYTISVARKAADTPPELSSDATLSSMLLSCSEALSPVFVPYHSQYELHVANAVASLTITPTTTDSNATVKVNGIAVASGSASGSIDLGVGPGNMVEIEVTAEDGSTLSYIINIIREESSGLSSDATLQYLEFDGPLSPVFDPAITTYTSTISAAEFTEIYVAPFTNDSNATVLVNGTPCNRGESVVITISGPSILSINIIVTAQDGTTKDYNITVTVNG
jgi:hypothetical protein